MGDVMFAHNTPHGRYGAWGYMYVVAALRLDESTEELGAGGGACNPSLNGLN